MLEIQEIRQMKPDEIVKAKKCDLFFICYEIEIDFDTIKNCSFNSF